MTPSSHYAQSFGSPWRRPGRNSDSQRDNRSKRPTWGHHKSQEPRRGTLGKQTKTLACGAGFLTPGTLRARTGRAPLNRKVSVGVGQVPRMAHAKGSHVLGQCSAAGHTPPGPGLGSCFLSLLVHYRGSGCFPFEINCPCFCSHVLGPTHCTGRQNLYLGTVPCRHSARCPRTQTHAFYTR